MIFRSNFCEFDTCTRLRHGHHLHDGPTVPAASILMRLLGQSLARCVMPPQSLQLPPCTNFTQLEYAGERVSNLRNTSTHMGV